MNSVGTDPEAGVDLKGDPAKMPDQNKRALLLEAVIASGLIVIGIPASQPLLTLAASVGGNWAFSLAERAFQHWRERWFTDDGVLNHDVAKALYHAFVDAVRQVEHDWKQHRHYQHLQHRSPERAQLTLDALRILREDGANLFQQPNQLTQIIQQEQQNRVLSLLYQDESKANEYLKSVLADFLYGHDDEFVTFITEQLGPQWILRFLEILKASNEEGTRAWRACQLLWQKSLMFGIDQIERTTAETADTVRWLKEWAQQLKNQTPTQRDSTGQDALETILHSVHAQLDEMQQTLNKTYDTTLSIKATLEQVYQKVAPAEIAPSAVWNVPYQRNLFFTGREDLLKQLHDNLTNRKAVALTQAISGLGGIGKTQTAVEYAYRYQDNYQYVLWVNAASRDTLSKDFRELAHLLNLPEKDEQDQTITIQAMKRWLEQHDHWLLIVDSADDLALAEDFLPTGGKGNILLTTRDQAPGPLAEKIDVEKMDEDEGMLFLLRRAKVLAKDAPLAQASETDRVAAEKIVKAMDGLPLALDQAGAYIEETHCGVSGYFESYRNRQAELLNLRGRTGKEHPEPVATTWSLSFHKVVEHNPMATDLLQVCAFLAPDAIPVEIFVKGASELGPHIQPLTTDATRLNEAIGVLLRYSLVKRDPQEPILSIHRLVQAVLKESMSEQMQREWAKRTVRAVDLAFPSFPDVTDVTLWKQCEHLLPHAHACKTLIEQWNFTFPEAGRLLYETGRYLFDRAQYAQAEQLYELALSIRKQAGSTGHYDTARTLHALAWLYKDQGQYEQERTELLEEALKIRKHVSRILYELAWVYKDQGLSKEAEPLFEAVLNVRKEIAGDEQAEKASALHALAQLYQEQGRYEEAELRFTQALEIRKQALGPQHPQVADSLHALAWLYQIQRRYQEAETLYQRAWAIREQVLGPRHPLTAETLRAIGQLYQDQGWYEEAKLRFTQALEGCKQALGPQHPQVADSLHALAWLYQIQGCYQEAEPLFEEALAIREQALGPQHPQVADSLHALAWLYRLQGKYKEAELRFTQALKVRKQVRGPQHSQTADSLHALAQLYQDQGRYQKAEPLFEEALEARKQVLGPQNPQTADSLHALAWLYQIQGRYQKAEPLFEEALAIREQVLGSQHPQTADSLHALAQLYQDQGKYEQAESCLERTLEIKQVLGTQHPQVADSLHALAWLYQKQGRYEEAEPLYQRALAIREQAPETEHPQTTETLRAMGQLYQKQGRYEEAEPLYLRALAIHEQVPEPEHPRTDEMLYTKGLLFQVQGRYEEAETLYQQALNIVKQQLGPGHPTTVTVRESYDDLVGDMKQKGKEQH